MRRASIALMAAVYLTVPGMIGCSQEAPGDDGAAMGSVSLPLVTATNSAIYRLTDATFTIDGPTPASLSSSDEPAEDELTTTLAPGSYDVVLEPGWALERDAGSGFVEVSATLLSQNPRSFTIQPSAITTLTYLFETDGTVVGTGDGQLAVNVQVDDSSPRCTPFGGGCPTGSWCAEGVSPGLGCIAAGSSSQGQSCSAHTSCGANSLCFPEEPEESPFPFPSVPVLRCTEFCAPEQVGAVCPTSGLTCIGVGNPGFGICQ